MRPQPLRDAVRLAVGTLTVLPVRPPTQVGRVTAGRAMLLAPAVAAVLGATAEGVVLVVRWAGDGWGDRLLAVVLALLTLAVLTRGLHLDGLADTVDGLGSRRTGADALAVMRRPDVGAFGVVAVVLVLQVDAAGLLTALADGRGTLALVGGATCSRLVLPWACRRGVPAASPHGLGAAVAESVTPAPLVATTVAVIVGLSALTVADDDLTWGFVPHTLLAAAVALTAGLVLLRRCRVRFGGVSGDVLGAAVEVTFAVFVVVVALG